MQQQLAGKLAPLRTRHTPLSCSTAVEMKLYASLTSTLDRWATNTTGLNVVTAAMNRLQSTCPTQRKPLSKFRYKLGAFRYTSCDLRENLYSEIHSLPQAENQILTAFSNRLE